MMAPWRQLLKCAKHTLDIIYTWTFNFYFFIVHFTKHFWGLTYKWTFNFYFLNEKKLWFYLPPNIPNKPRGWCVLFDYGRSISRNKYGLHDWFIVVKPRIFIWFNVVGLRNMKKIWFKVKTHKIDLFQLRFSKKSFKPRFMGVTRVLELRKVFILEFLQSFSTRFNKVNLFLYLISWLSYVRYIISTSFSFGFYYMQSFLFILFIDSCLTDDEPLWEPIEWSLIQTWILFIFIFGWIAENLIVSRYGSYTGRDKRVWMAWYKTFWLVEIYYVINFLVTVIFVIVPYYFEQNYSLAFVYSWWHWYSRVFFFKFISLFTIIILLSYCLQIGLRWLSWRKGLVIILLINVFLAYLIYTHFIISFFGYFTDPIWYQKTRPNDYIQLSHEPSRWGWGPSKKDHFTYHNVKTVFWYKNDGPFASAFLLMNMYVFLSLFFVYIWWVTLFRRVYSTKEIPLTYTTYCISSLKQFFYCFLGLYIFIFFSYIINYWRLPIEYLGGLDNVSWFTNLFYIICDYPTFLVSIFF